MNWKKKTKKKQANYQTLWKHCDQTMIGVKSASDWLSGWREHSTPITDSNTAKTRQWLISLHIGAIIET